MAPADLVEPPLPTPVNTAGDLVEAAKKAAGRKAVEDYLSHHFRYVGIGSGSTIKYVVEAIADLPRDVTAKMKFVPTGSQSRELIREAKLTVLAIDDLVLEPELLSVHTHPITCSLGEPTRHLDLRFVVRAADGAHIVRSAESNDLRWWPVDDLPGGEAGAERDALSDMISRAASR